MGHKEDTGKTFGPGHNGWYGVRWMQVVTSSPEKTIASELTAFTKAKSAFQAAAACGKQLPECKVFPITDADAIKKLEEQSK